MYFLLQEYQILQYQNNVLQHNKIENYDIGSDDVGYRYIQGIIHADAEYYFLLDYDDIFLSDKIPTITYLLQDKYDVVKESEFYKPNMNLMKNVIRNNIDWHISQYSFNKHFKDICQSILFLITLDIIFNTLL